LPIANCRFPDLRRQQNWQSAIGNLEMISWKHYFKTFAMVFEDC
jgi:hypothetical protein